MIKRRKFQFLLAGLIIFSIVLVSNSRGNVFSLDNFWEIGGSLSYEDEFTGNHEIDLLDFEYRTKGTYIYDGLSSSENALFNITEAPIYSQDILILDPDTYFSLVFRMEKYDEVNYEFAVLGGSLDFFIFKEDQFNLWNDSETRNQSQVAYSLSLQADLVDLGIFISPNAGNYYFVWLNNASINNDIILVLFQLDAQLSEETFIQTLEFNPINLETTEGEKITYLGMDTSDWEIDKKITFEIVDKDTEFTIIREDEFEILYNNVTTKIPCWVLEKEDFEIKEPTSEGTFTYKTDFQFWKSKYSGITLKSIADSDIYNGTSSLIATIYEKFTAKSAEHVQLVPRSSGIVFPFLPALLGILVLIRFKKKKYEEKKN
ncbi:MAG: hypothetical protein ACFE9L_04460 [Candidatus Hodarchaeota archaeon]